MIYGLDYNKLNDVIVSGSNDSQSIYIYLQ